jgi:hypothetical protein
MATPKRSESRNTESVPACLSSSIRGWRFLKRTSPLFPRQGGPGAALSITSFRAMMAFARVPLDQVSRKGLALVVGVSLLACSGRAPNGSGGATGQSPVVDLAAARQFVTAYCNLLLPCCSKEGLPASINACLRLNDSFTRFPFDAAIAKSCLEKARNAASEPTFCISPPLCDDAFILPGGTTPPGQPCTLGDQCAVAPGGQATCSLVAVDLNADGGLSIAQTCTQLTNGQLGQEPCAGTVTDLVTCYTGPPGAPAHAFLCNVSDGLYCDSNTGQCTALATTGQSCDGNVLCVAGDYCGPSLDPSNLNSGSCAPLLANGAPCDPNTFECVPLSYCNPTSTTCNPQVAYGSACTVDAQCLTGLCANGSCGPSAIASLFCGP